MTPLWEAQAAESGFCLPLESPPPLEPSRSWDAANQNMFMGLLPEVSSAHNRTQSLPVYGKRSKRRRPQFRTLDLSTFSGYAFSHPSGRIAAPEVQFSADMPNPWMRNDEPLVRSPTFKPEDVIPNKSFEATHACPATGLRRFQVLNDAINLVAFGSNAIRTTKYTPLNFVALNLFDQFRRLANCYFLLISVLQLLPVSSVQPTMWFPLLIVVATNMVKEAVEDFRRHKMDKELNRLQVLAVDPTGVSAVAMLQLTQWRDLNVGHVVLVREDEAVPADIIVIATSDERTGFAYIDTAQLDGETNLKHRESVQVVHESLVECGLGSAVMPGISQASVALLQKLWVEVEPPNDRLHRFEGVVHIGSTKLPIANDQTMYRGCFLRNTQWVLGVVAYTGMDTKLLRNATEKRFKSTILDKQTNRYVLYIFWALVFICLLSSALSVIVAPSSDTTPFYLWTSDPWGSTFGLNIMTWLILYCSLIPISLTVTSEIVKTFHAHFINCDLEMCYTDPLTGRCTPAQARTSNLGEDLGRVQYVLTDKTGTLTRNVMEFMKCSIGGRRYGTGMTEIGAAAMAAGRGELFQAAPEESAAPERPPGLTLEQGNNFWDPRISDEAWLSLPEAERMAVEKFFTHLAICHTLLAKVPAGTVDWTPNTVQYQASSPDELALVMGAKGAGFWFKQRVGSQVTVVTLGTERVYDVLNICEFNSTRKRMSCVVRTPDQRLVLLCKGADNVISSLLDPRHSNPEVNHQTQRHLLGFANEGLRTLALAVRALDPEWYAGWNRRYVDALTALQGREELLHEVALEIERDLCLVGATAIEDKLQEGVPATLHHLLQANIKVWMLTGDKLETAINIALACNLIQSHMYVEKITPQEEGDVDGSAGSMADGLFQQLQKVEESLETMDVAMIVDGVALECLLADEYKLGLATMGKFLAAATRCCTVVCCRVSPKQKADVTHLVRKKQHTITLSIGDGANDVPMILNASIGVGISGQEGMQAVMSADYAIAQFRFLERLLLVHGRWSCQRISLLILYFFNKNCNVSLIHLWYGIYSMFCGVSFLNDIYSALWNCGFTALPIFCTSMFNKDAKYTATLLAHPQLYREVQNGSDFTAARFLWWMVDAVYCAVVAYFIPHCLIDSSPWPSGQMIGRWEHSFISYFCLHLLTNLRLALNTRTWPQVAVWIMGLTILIYFPFSVVFDVLPNGFPGTMPNTVYATLSTPHFWLASLLCTVVYLLPPFAQMSARKVFSPSPTQCAVMREAELERSLKQRGVQPTEVSMQQAYQALSSKPSSAA
eukprot:GGOE01022581.1.p1 GENE.GGOE01022581.1~~GGOE01022581.1.p1  ORF type:complete len:1289 (-),score=411.61 GGOE01022581.1:579-4445(-)